MTTNVSTNLFHRVGGLGAVLRALVSNSSIYRFAMMGLSGDPWLLPLVVHYIGL